MKKILLAAALSAAFAAAPASAQVQVYVGAGVGSAKTDTRETSLKLLGGLQADENWGIEGAVTDLGRYRGADAKALSLALTGTLPLDRQWSLMAKAGGARTRTQYAGASGHMTSLVGVGVEFAVSRVLSLRLEYEQYGRLSDPGTGFNDKADNLALIGKISL